MKRNKEGSKKELPQENKKIHKKKQEYEKRYSKMKHIKIRKRKHKQETKNKHKEKQNKNMQ